MHIAILGFIATRDLLPASAIHPSYPKGREGAPLITNLIKAYLNMGHRVLAITHDDTLSADEPSFILEDGLLTYVVVPCRQRIFRPNGKRIGRNLDFYRFERRRMREILDRFQPEVVHAHWTYEFAMAALSYTSNAIITIHDNAQVIFNYVRTLNRFFLLLMARQVFRKGLWFTAVSPYMADSVSHWASQKVLVVPNPVTLPDQLGEPAPVTKPIISVVVNGWDDRKNNINALLSFKALLQRHPNAELWAMGTAFEPGKEAEVFCREQGISNVVFMGTTKYSTVLENISRSTFVLHSSLEESFGMVLVEAMSYGIPVVAGKDSGAVPWVVQDGGLLVDVTKVEAMTEAMHQLLTDAALYRRLSQQGLEMVRARFPLETVARQYLEIYQTYGVTESAAVLA